MRFYDHDSRSSSIETTKSCSSKPSGWGASTADHKVERQASSKNQDEKRHDKTHGKDGEETDTSRVADRIPNFEPIGLIEQISEQNMLETSHSRPLI